MGHARWRVKVLPDGHFQPQYLDAEGQVMLAVPVEHCYVFADRAEQAVFRLADDCAAAALHWRGLPEPK